MSNTSELFEFNKMWLTFGLTLIIASAWITKIIIERSIRIQRTVLDLPILFFLTSQVLATIFSIDPHTSLWGYYSRFNGGLYSLVSYAFLYFAYVSNIEQKNNIRYILTGIASAIFVSLWGLPSHFGYDPTCLVFRGTLDVSCWTFAFQPKVRIFSTLGQPDWLAAYLAYMIPIILSLGILLLKAKQKFAAVISLGILVLFFIDLLYTRARSGFIGFGASLFIFLLVYIAFEWRSFTKHALIKAIKNNAFLLISLFVFALFTFFIGSPISQLDRFSLSGVQSFIAAKQTTQALQEKKTPPAAQPVAPAGELGGTDSGKIRLFVWQGAWEIFLHYPLFGTGVETFGYSYYFFRPAGHNLTSEWDYLYNKAHNEFLNYLATTGAVGFIAYMVMLGFSIWIMIQALLALKKQPQEDKKADIFSTSYSKRLLYIAFLASYISILVTNFFGFSVVIMNVYLLLTPAFALLTEKSQQLPLFVFPKKLFVYADEIEWLGIGAIWIICFYFIYVLIRFWIADTSYAMGINLDHANQYQTAYSYLHDAVATRPSEPTFQDELAINDAVLAQALAQQKDATTAGRLRDEAIAVSDQLVSEHPHVVTYWKSRVRVFYSLAQVDPQYLNQALAAIIKASQLAPTDAKVWYNLGLMYDQAGHVDNAITTLEQTVRLKPDYRDAYYALALFYRQRAIGGNANNKQVVDTTSEHKAVETMHLILTDWPNDDLKIRDTLSSWGEK